MSDASQDRLYNLLPAIYRLRDAAQGEPLRALLAVVSDELQLLEDNIGELYDNWFIETCAEWVVPYIGDLLGVRAVHPIQAAGFTQRAYVANTLAYRRRKGTAAVLEQLAHDLTGWPAVAVEFFERLVTTQNLNHQRLGNPASPDLRDQVLLDFTGSAFDRVAHTVDVRHIDRVRGKYNIPNVGLFLWRLQAYHLDGIPAHQVAPADKRRFTFNPLGSDQRLVNLPQSEATMIGQQAAPLQVPLPLSRRFLDRNLEACYGTDDDPRGLLIRAGGAAIPLANIVVCDLSDKPAGGWVHTPASGSVGVDPELGRIAFGSDPAGPVDVHYTYAFPGDLGGGPYDRQESLKAFVEEFGRSQDVWQIGVTRQSSLLGPQVVGSLAQAVAAWNALPPGTTGIIAVMDSGTYRENLTGASAIRLPAGSRLLLVAAGWPEEPGSPGQRSAGHITPSFLRPLLEGALEVVGTAAAGTIQPGAILVNGWLLAGAVTVLPGNLAELTLAHCTLVPALASLTLQTGPAAGQNNDGLSLALERSICGPLNLPAIIRSAALSDSIVDGGIQAPVLQIQACTVLGPTQCDSLSASDGIFTEKVTVAHKQEGCVRFCYLPLASETPRRYECQPADAATAGSVFPHFASVAYGDPDYAQLARTCPPAILGGAEDGGEMGAFHFLQVSGRLANLRIALDEYLRFGLEAGVFFAS
jgi:hypothetical protein